MTVGADIAPSDDSPAVPSVPPPPARVNRGWVTLLVLVLAVAAYAALKFWMFARQPFFDCNDGRYLLWSELAYRYYFAEKAARGEPLGDVDVRAQYPEGVRIEEDLAPWVDLAVGGLYRRLGLAGLLPFHLFLVGFTFAFSALSLIAVYAAGRALWSDGRAGLLAVLLYGLSRDAMVRSAQCGYLREDYALVFIFLAFALYLCSARRFRWPAAIGAGLATFGALAVWHMSSFCLIIIFAAAGLETLAVGELPGGRRTLAVILAFVVAAAVTLPHLWAKWFLGSPLVLGLAAVVLAGWWADRTNAGNGSARGKWPGWARVLAAGGLFAAMVGLSAALHSEHYGEFSHVYRLMAAKIRFLGRPPADPSRLDYESRHLWAAGFLSPSTGFFMLTSAPLLVLGLAMWLNEAGRAIGRSGPWWRVTVTLPGMVFLVLYLMMVRMAVFPAFFWAALAGGLAVSPAWGRRRFTAAILVVYVLGQAVLLRGVRFFQNRPEVREVRQVVERLDALSGRDDPVLCPFPMGSTVLAYGDRPTIVHSNIEAPGIRHKLKRYELALFEDEEAFAALCREWGARWFIYDTEMAMGVGPATSRYVAAKPTLRDPQVVFRFHFYPEKLRHFRLRFQTTRYRLFEVVSPEAPPAAAPPYDPMYDPDLFLAFTGEVPDETIRRTLQKLVQPMFHLQLGHRLKLAGEIGKAREVYQGIARRSPGWSAGFFNLGLLAWREGRGEEALRLWARAYALAPGAQPAADGLVVFDATDRALGAPAALAAAGSARAGP